MSKYSMEVQDQFNYFALKVCNQILHFVLFFNDTLDEGILKKAILRSLQKEPILNCHLVRRDDQAYWETSADSDCAELFEVVKTQNAKQDLEIFLTKTIDVEKESLVQVRLFRNDNDILCIKISHAVSDAGGLKAYASLLASLYSSLANVKETKLFGHESIARGQNQFIQNLTQDERSEMKERSRGFMQSMVPNWSYPSQNHNTTRPAYVIRRLDGNDFYGIKNAARLHNATLNDFFLAAFCRALQIVAGHPANYPMIVQVPVDLRRYLNDKTTPSVCNMSGSEYLRILLNSDENFLLALQKVKQYMQAVKNDYPGLESAFALEGLAHLGFAQAMKMIHGAMEQSIIHNVSIPILTNMGSIPFESKNYGNLTAADGYIVSPAVYSPGFMMGISSFNDVLTMTVGFNEDAIARETIEKFIDEMASQMFEAVSA